MDQKRVKNVLAMGIVMVITLALLASIPPAGFTAIAESCTQSSCQIQDTGGQLPYMSIDELTTLMKGDKGFLLVDARSSKHYGEGHIPGAISMPLADIPDYATYLDKNWKVVTYCGSFNCSLSTKAANEFIRLGFKDVSDYKGGIEEWKAKGRPVEPS